MEKYHVLNPPKFFKGLNEGLNNYPGELNNLVVHRDIFPIDAFAPADLGVSVVTTTNLEAY